MKWYDVPVSISPPPIEVDPYKNWCLGPGKEDFLLATTDAQRVPHLIRLNTVKAALFEKKRGITKLKQDLYSRITGREFDAQDPIDKDNPYRTQFPERSDISLLADPQNADVAETIKSVSLGPPLLSDSVGAFGAKPNKKHSIQSSSLSPETVVIGIIDDGLPIGHERFRNSDGETRVEAIWIQDGKYDGGQSGFTYGREISRPAINDALSKSLIAGSVDEDAFYRELDLNVLTDSVNRPINFRSTHGAHVMDIACGFDPDDAPDWRIVCVQLPVATTRNTSGATLAPYAIDAVKYIIEKAKEIAGEGSSVPVVINFSYGITAGPHDGTHDLEKAIDKLLRKNNSDSTKKPIRVVLPAGNSRQNRGHATHRFAPPLGVGPKEKFDLTWQVQPDDLTPSFVEIWLPPSVGISNRITLEITTPDGLPSMALEEGSTGHLELRDEDLPAGKNIVCQARYHFAETTSEKGMFFIALQPTARVDGRITPVPTAPIAPSGPWTITLTNQSLSNETVHAWIQRDDTPYGYPRRGRQSYFDHPLYLRYDYNGDGREIDVDEPNCPVKRDGMLNGIATGKRTVVLGGLTLKEAKASIYSAGGLVPAPVAEPMGIRMGPEALTVSEDSLVHRGILGAGTRSSSVVSLGGTSVAAPRITRWIAETLSQPFAGPDAGNRESVRLFAVAEDAILPGDTPAVERGGGGRIIFPSLRTRGNDF